MSAVPRKADNFSFNLLLIRVRSANDPKLTNYLFMDDTNKITKTTGFVVGGISGAVVLIYFVVQALQYPLGAVFSILLAVVLTPFAFLLGQWIGRAAAAKISRM